VLDLSFLRRQWAIGTARSDVQLPPESPSLVPEEMAADEDGDRRGNHLQVLQHHLALPLRHCEAAQSQTESLFAQFYGICSLSAFVFVLDSGSMFGIYVSRRIGRAPVPRRIHLPFLRLGNDLRADLRPGDVARL
jgi:hypothetical protein